MATPTTCPNCDYPIGASRRALCPNCHYPLILQDEETSKHAVAGEGLTRPTRRVPADETTLTPVVTSEHAAATGFSGVGAAAMPAGAARCPSCGHPNDGRRQRCERCAADLHRATAPPPLAPPPRARGSRTTIVLVLALLVALAVGAAAAWALLGPRSEAPAGGAGRSASSATATAGRAEAVPAHLIEAAASSELPSESGRFAITNTLDGDPATVWNSNGKKVGPDGPVTLTYTFAAPVDLRRIDIVNGSQKSPESFSDNGRPRLLTIRGDGPSDTVELRDVDGAQRLDFDWGPTSTLTITITSVYRDDRTRFADMAISDVTFFAVK